MRLALSIIFVALFLILLAMCWAVGEAWKAVRNCLEER